MDPDGQWRRRRGDAASTFGADGGGRPHPGGRPLRRCPPRGGLHDGRHGEARRLPRRGEAADVHGPRRGLERVPVQDGEHIAPLLSLDDLLQRAAGGSACLEPGDEPKGKFIYNLLAQVCHGKALALVRLIPRADGASAWRSLVQAYEPDEASMHCALLAGLMSPDWKEDVPFADLLLAWEKRLTEYEVAAVATVPDTFKCAIVMKYAPKSVKEFLRITQDFTRDYRTACPANPPNTRKGV